MSTIFPTSPATRITLLDEAGDPAVRWTLQASDREGREIRFQPEGVLATLGSGTGWQRKWKHNGFRQELGIKWSAGLTSTREAWVSGAWSAGSIRPTAEAHCEVLEWAALHQVTVEPFLGQPMPSFTATAYEKGPSLQDTKGIIHPRLELALKAVALSTKLTLIGGWGCGPWGLLAWGD